MMMMKKIKCEPNMRRIRRYFVPDVQGMLSLSVY
jgi:hypothetical protein